MRTPNDILLDLKSREIELNKNTTVGKEMNLPFIVKFLSVFGGVTTMSFVLFLYVLLQLHHNHVATLITSGLFVLSSVMLSRNKLSLLFNSFAITMYISGIIWGIYSMQRIGYSDEAAFAVIGVVGIIAWLFSGSYLLKTLCVITTGGALITSNYTSIKIHLHVLIYLYTALFFIATAFEHKLLSKEYKVSPLFYSLRAGSMFLLVYLLGLLSFNTPDFEVKYNWISSIPFAVILFYLTHLLNIKLEVKSPVYSFLIAGVICLSAFMAPYLLGGLTILLLSFYVNYRTGIGVGILAVIYSVSRYYYDLELTLLEKSGVMFGTGLCFVLIYLILKKNLKDEK